MKCEMVMTVVLLLCLWPGAHQALGQERLSLSELEGKTLAELEQEQQRLARLVSDVDEPSQATTNHLAKARAMGEIVRLQYLARMLHAVETRLTVVQRHSKAIPGLAGESKVRIGDITRGQTLLEIVSGEVSVVDPVSVREGDVTPFTIGGEKRYLTVVELRNFLLGDDFAVFEISTRRPDESEEIEQLLKTIEASGVVFIRNGREASASEAATHLRKKWQNNAMHSVTVLGFIERVASRSSVTGNPYQVKLPDDSIVSAGIWLREQADP